MTVTVGEQDGRFHAGIPSGDVKIRCCEAGHQDAAEAARHAWQITQAMTRKTRCAPATG